MDLLARAEGYRLIGAALRYPDPEEIREDLADGPLAELAELVDEDLPGEHNRLFATSVAVSPYESGYLRMDKGMRVGQLGVLYEAFGIRCGGRERELADHAGTEAEFMAALCVMLERARRAGHVEDAEVTARAREIFATEHVGRWFGRFGAALSERAAHPFYARLGERIGAWVQADLDDHGWVPEEGEAWTAPREEDCVACPMAPKEEL